MISEDVMLSMQRSVLCWLATVDEDGWPNVSPKEVFTPLDAHRLVIANIASPKSAKNIVATSKVCVSWVDVFVQKGFKVRGTATSVTKDAPAFQTLAAPLEAMTQGRFPIQSVFLVQVQFIEQIIAPSYRFFPGETTEEAQIASAMQAYGVVQSAKNAA